MRCKSCNKVLQPGSIKFNKDLQDFEVCGECLSIVREMMEGYEARDRVKGMVEDDSDPLEFRIGAN